MRKFLNGDYTTGFYVGTSNENYYTQENSADVFYQNAIDFTNWVNENLSEVQAKDAMEADGTVLSIFANRSDKIFAIGPQNDPEKEESDFYDHRCEVIKYSIQTNLSQSIANYNNNSESLGSTYNFEMPVLTAEEWQQVLSNVSMITFVQGLQVGTKIFNDYAIVNSTKNKQYISDSSLYFINTEGGDGYYHKITCSHLHDDNTIVGYKASEFDRQSYETTVYEKGLYGNYAEGEDIGFSTKTNYYYIHQNYACYYCIVNSSEDNTVEWNDVVKYPDRVKAFYTAKAREKYNFYKTNNYFSDDIVR